MGKKKQEILIKKEELEPTTLGKVTQNKANILPLVFLVLIFLAAIYFAPQIETLYQNYIDKDSNINNQGTTSDNNNTNKTTEQTETINKYDYVDNMEISNDKIKISSLVIKNKNLSFKLNNLTDNYLNLDNYNYYLEFYNGDTLLVRQIIEKIGLQKNASQDFSYDFGYTNVNKVVLRNIDRNDYPEVTIKVDSDKKGTLICKKGTETITYYSSDSKIYSISDTVTYLNTLNDYQSQYTKYKNLVTSFSNTTGITASLNDTSTGFTYNLLIDLSVAKLTNIDNSNYYAKDTSINVINFELEANGYSCS